MKGSDLLLTEAPASYKSSVYAIMKTSYCNVTHMRRVPPEISHSCSSSFDFRPWCYYPLGLAFALGDRSWTLVRVMTPCETGLQSVVKNNLGLSHNHLVFLVLGFA